MMISLPHKEIDRMNESLSPKQVTEHLEEGKLEIKNALIQIGATPTDETLERIMDGDLKTRQTVWQGIFRSMQIGAKSFDDYLLTAEGEIPRDTIEALKTLHDFLNFDEGSLLRDLGIGIRDDRSDSEIIEESEGWEHIFQYQTGAKSHFLPSKENWLFRTYADRIIKETEKAYQISLDGSEHATCWIPKSVIIGIVKNQSKDCPGGFLIADGFAIKNAQSGGPYCKINIKGELI